MPPGSQIANQYAITSPQPNEGYANRMRESSSGAIVGKNIAGVGNIGKSSSNIIKEDRMNFGKMGDKNKFITHGHHSSEINDRYLSKHKATEGHQQNSANALPAARNLQLHRITSQYDRKAQQQILNDQQKHDQE